MDDNDDNDSSRFLLDSAAAAVNEERADGTNPYRVGEEEEEDYEDDLQDTEDEADEWNDDEEEESYDWGSASDEISLQDWEEGEQYLRRKEEIAQLTTKESIEVYIRERITSHLKLPKKHHLSALGKDENGFSSTRRPDSKLRNIRVSNKNLFCG